MLELEHVAFGDQPIAEIDSANGKIVAVAIDEPCAVGMDEVGWRGAREIVTRETMAQETMAQESMTDERDGKEQRTDSDADPPCSADAHRLSSFKARIPVTSFRDHALKENGMPMTP
jgi:hypothetical protein